MVYEKRRTRWIKIRRFSSSLFMERRSSSLEERQFTLKGVQLQALILIILNDRN